MRLLGLYREIEYSPGRHRSNDAMLLEQVAAGLRARGLALDLSTIDRAAPFRQPATLVFSMCQGRSALETLARWEFEGTRIVNSPRASFNTYRDRLAPLMRRAGVSFPPTTLMKTTAVRRSDLSLIEAVNGGVWLKRGDVHASVSADVQWVDSAARLAAALDDFAERGIANAAIQPHQPGDEIKFYGVAGSAFFHWFYPGDDSSAAGAKKADRIQFDAAALARLARAAAAAAGLDIFGGDVIVSPGGELTLIDLNDWPSFAPCREPAAAAIAGYLMRRVDAAWNRGLVSSANESAL